MTNPPAFLEQNPTTISKYWMLLAIISLTIAGLFSLPPVFLRGSLFKDMFDLEHIFAVSLVIHVDMSAVIWLLAVGCVFWGFYLQRKWLFVQYVSLFLAIIGTSSIVLSAFLGDGEPIKNNYIPVLTNHIFFFGLVALSLGVSIQVILTLLHIKDMAKTSLHFGCYCAAFITFIAFVCFILSFQYMPSYTTTESHAYYELLFWGGGHIFQFTFTQLVLVTWIFLSRINQLNHMPSEKFIYGALLLNVIAVLPTPLAYVFYDTLEDTLPFFTAQMQYTGGISAAIIGCYIIYAQLRTHSRPTNLQHIQACLILSIFLFGFGGILGFMISGSNASIPAHYHGSTVAITLAFMGMIYWLLPTFNMGNPQGKLATIQPYLYGGGQLMHIVGLAWMGGYGALRKAPGTSQNIDTISGKILFFSGGSIAIIGGMLFLVIIYLAMFQHKKHRP